MVFFNYATMQMAAKIVYYGPGLCGKTTNLHHIYAKTSPQSRGEMVSLETETDRTLFFDLLPLDVGVVGGFKTRLQLYTVPGQVFYNTTRKLVLKGADGIVFVADSQRPMLEANVDSLRNLRENLAEIGLDLDEIPVVMQLNKRDLPNVHEPKTILDALDPDGKYEHVEASAVTGQGVFETLKVISKLTLRTLRKRMMGEETKQIPPKRPPARPAAGAAVFTVHSGTTPAAPPRPAPPPPVEPVAPPPELESRFTAEVPLPELDFEEAPPLPAPPTPEIDLPVPPTLETIEELPAPEPAAIEQQSAPFPDIAGEEVAPEAEEPEPEISFAQTTEKETKPVEPEVKHVKVRSTVDIMAELEQLRKKATQSPPARARVDVLSALDALTTAKPKRELAKSVKFHATADTPKKARRMKVVVTFENDESGVLQQHEQQVELDRADWSALQLNVKIDLDG